MSTQLSSSNSPFSSNTKTSTIYTVDEFNQLPVESQQLIISNYLENKTSEEEKSNLTKVKNLLEYLNSNNDQIGQHLFSFACKNKEKNIEEIICQINEIELSHQVTEVLHAKSQLNSTDF